MSSVFAAVELLAERKKLEVSPFVASWHPAVDAWDRQAVRGLFGNRLQRTLVSEQGREAQALIEEVIDAKTGVGTGATYEMLARKMIHELRAIVASRHKELAYLKPLVDVARRLDGLTVATLNYDVAIEQLCEEEEIEVETGIDGWIGTRRWEWSDDGVSLLKLHGSIDWCWDTSGRAPGHMDVRVVAETTNPLSEDREPVLVFGQRGKLRAEGPFLSLLGEFDGRLSRSDCLLVIGYSFRDDHINEIVRRWTRLDASRRIVLVDPNLPEYFDKPEFRSELIERLNPRADGDETPPPHRVEIRRESASAALAQIAGSN